MRRAFWWSLAALMVVLVPFGARAEEGLLPARLDPSFKGLPFGGTRDQVLEVMVRRVQDRYGAQIRDTLDVRDRDRLGREMQKEIDDIRASKIVFDGTQTGWNVSILQDEFQNGAGEEMVLVREGNARFYLFFTNGVFYKMIQTPQDPSREAAFAALQATYGNAATVEYGDAKKTRVDHAEWTDAGPVGLEMRDFTRQFQTVMIRWALKDKDAPIRAAIGKRRAVESGLNPLIKAAQEPAEAGPDEPVDDLIGKQSPVPKLKEKAKKKGKK